MIRRLRSNDEDGFTLIELLLASAMMVILVSALVGGLLLALRTSVGLSPASTVSAQDTRALSAQIDAHIGVQSLTRYFTADVENANSPTDVIVNGDNPGPTVACTRPSPDPTLSLTGELPLAQVTAPGISGTGSDVVTYVYSKDVHLHFGEIVRYTCAASGGAASAVVVARGLSTATLPSAGHQTPTASIPKDIFSLTVTTVASRTYRIEATPAINKGSANGGGGAGQTPPTPFTSILMQDVGGGSTRNGKIDQ